MKKRWTALLLLISLALGMAGFGPAALAESRTVYVASNTLKVYKKASTSSKLLGVMAYAEKLSCLAVSDSWARVENASGDIGYCKKSSLTTENPNTLDKTVYITKSGVKVYSRPSTSAEVLVKVGDGDLKKGYTAVAVTSDGDWVRLKNGKSYGYAQMKYISSAPAADEAADELSETVYVSSNTLKVYKKTSTSSAVLGTMSFGESLTLLQASDEWAKVRNDSGSVGYCKLSALTDENPNGLPVTAYATKDDVKVYKRPSTSADVLKKLEEGKGVDMVAVNKDRDWARVELSGGKYGYVQTKFLVLDALPAEPEQIPGEDYANLEGTTAYVTSATLKVYKHADAEADVLGTLAYGEETTLLKVSDGWAMVRSGSGSIGYCGYGGLSDENPNTYDKTIYASGDGTRVYVHPNDDASVAATLDRNQSMTLVAVLDDLGWGRVRLSSGAYGYVQADNVSTSPVEDEASNAPVQTPAPEEDASDTAKAVIALATKQLGDPYVYSACGPDKFDCSGLVYYCYKEAAGIKLNRTAYSQGYDDKYQKISDAKDLQPGDLVFFDTNSGDSDLSDHSGIYIGGGKFIHASSAASKVIQSSLSSGYYARTFSWGRRVL